MLFREGAACAGATDSFDIESIHEMPSTSNEAKRDDDGAGRWMRAEPAASALADSRR
jgi:hypothetical protein